MRRRAAHLTAWWLPCVRLPAAEASPYDGPNTGPVFIAVRMSVLTNLGEGISVPVIATQVCVTCRRPGETPAGWPALRGWLASPAAVRVAHASQLQLTACSETGGRSVTLSVRADGLSQRRHRHFRRLRRQPGPRGPALPHPPLLLGRCVACCCRLGGWSAASCRQRCRLQCSMSRGVTPARRLRPALLPSQCAGMTPDGVRSMQPGFFSRYFYLLAESGRGWYGYGRPQMVSPGRASAASAASLCALWRPAAACPCRTRSPPLACRRAATAAVACRSK